MNHLIEVPTTVNTCPHLQASSVCPLCIRDREIDHLKTSLSTVKMLIATHEPPSAVASIKELLGMS